MDKNEYYLMSENIFYYVVKDDISIKRDSIISDILGIDKTTYYLGSNSFIKNVENYVTDIRFARFWKTIKIKPINGTNKGHSIKSIKLKEFMNLDFSLLSDDFVVLRNRKLQEKEKDLKLKRDKIRSKYKATNAYKPIDDKDYYNWKKCKDCGLKPLIWEFDNGRSTACGCGENIYKHHSISAESIMSYVTRNNGSALNYNSKELMINWNGWVEFGFDKFKSIKEKSGEKIW